MLLPLFILVAALGAGIGLGGIMLIAAMLYSGKWTLPGTGMRRVQEAEVRAAVAKLRTEETQARTFREKIEREHELGQLEFDEHLDEFRHTSALRHAKAMLELEKGSE